MDSTAIATAKAIENASLATLAAEINHEHEAAIASARTAIEHARRCGEFWIEAKAAIGHGGFSKWLAENCRVKDRQCRNYMAVAAGWDRISNRHSSADLTITQALRLARPEAEHTSESVRAACVEANESAAHPLPSLSSAYLYTAFGELSAEPCGKVRDGIRSTRNLLKRQKEAMAEVPV